MHCPRCGQQQVSEETRFCSRCGLQLGLVAELLENDGFLPRLEELARGKRPIFTRKNGVIFSILWFIFWVMMMPAFIGMGAGEEDAAGVSAVFGVFTTMMFVVVSLGFLKATPKHLDLPVGDRTAAGPPGIYGKVIQTALPPQQSQPVSSYMPPEGSWKGPDTGEFAQPGSVTDETTRLLKKNQ